MIQLRSRRPIRKALRVTFQYDGETFELSGIKRVNAIAPPSDNLSVGDRNSGFWYEVRDSSDRTLYRCIREIPNRYAVEVRSDDPIKPLKWEPLEKPQGVFVVLIPDLETAQNIVLFSSPIKPVEVIPNMAPVQASRELEPAQEIVRFSLREADPERR